MCRSNFRIKLDLCKFYNDVRRFCWVFVDGTKMLQVTHMMEHITSLFNIQEPFHLLLNEIEYLPPNEDIRVLKESETILVCPGSGLESELELPATTTVPEIQHNFTKTERSNNSVHHKESQTNLSPMQLNPVSVQENLFSEVLNRRQSDALETSTMCDRTEDEENSVIDSKTTDTNITEDFSIIEDSVLRRKRKRTRRKKKLQEVEQPIIEEENKPRKPKIINSYIISSSKHIRFDNGDSQETVAKEIIHEESMNGSDTNKVSPPPELANLLSLGQNPVPVTFTNTKVKEEIKIEHMSDEEARLNTSFENTNENVALNNKLETNELLSKDLKTCPVMTKYPQLKDIIAFKMLKIGSDYTPQASEFIVAEVISYCPKTLMYTFKVLKGLSEVHVPVGKFTVVQDEEEHTLNDTITVNYAQLIESRLVSRSDQARATTPILNCTN